MRTATVELYRWTRQEFEQLSSMGIFDPEDRLELLDGEIFQMASQSSFHSTSLRLTEDWLREIYRRGYDVRVQMPLAIDNHSLPEPDIAVVVGTVRDYRDAHPTTALLLVEVADSSLEHDKGRKRLRYAAVGIPEYWIINLRDYCLEVYQDPVNGVYQTARVLFAHDTVAPLSRPDFTIAVEELLP